MAMNSPKATSARTFSGRSLAVRDTEAMTTRPAATKSGPAARNSRSGLTGAHPLRAPQARQAQRRRAGPPKAAADTAAAAVRTRIRGRRGTRPRYAEPWVAVLATPVNACNGAVSRRRRVDGLRAGTELTRRQTPAAASTRPGDASEDPPLVALDAQDRGNSGPARCPAVASLGGSPRSSPADSERSCPSHDRDPITGPEDKTALIRSRRTSPYDDGVVVHRPPGHGLHRLPPGGVDGVSGPDVSCFDLFSLHGHRIRSRLSASCWVCVFLEAWAAQPRTPSQVAFLTFRLSGLITMIAA